VSSQRIPSTEDSPKVFSPRWRALQLTELISDAPIYYGLLIYARYVYAYERVRAYRETERVCTTQAAKNPELAYSRIGVPDPIRISVCGHPCDLVCIWAGRVLRCRSPRMQRSSYRFPTSCSLPPSLFLSLSSLAHTAAFASLAHSRAPFVVAQQTRCNIQVPLPTYLPMRRNGIAELPSFNFPDLLDITRGCHAAYKRPRINDQLAL